MNEFSLINLLSFICHWLSQIKISEIYFPNFDLFYFLVEFLIAIVEAVSSIMISRYNGLIVFQEIYSKFISAEDRTEFLFVVNCFGGRDNTEGSFVSIGIILI